MKGDGVEEEGLREFLSVGGASRSMPEGASAKAGAESVELSLNMLAGGSSGGFTLKPPPVGHLSGVRSLALGGWGERTSFYRASVPKTTWSSSPGGMGMLFVNDEAGEAGASSSSHRKGSGIVAKLEQPLRTHVENLTPEECWSVVLKLGKRWPAWNRTPISQPSQGVVNERSSLLEAVDERLGGKPETVLGHDSLKLLASRALESLAQTPDRHCRSWGSMQARKITPQQASKARAARDLTSQAADLTPAASRELSAKPPTPPRVMDAPPTSSAGRRTAPLTIFYDGKVNVCDNVPEDKAHLIMLFAERSNIKPNTQAPAPPSSAVPSTSASPQVTSVVSSPAPSHPALGTHAEGSSSHQKPTGSSNPSEVAQALPTEGNARQLMQQCLNGPMSKRLPNARKNSLARFLDSRKRLNASSSDEQPSKKQELGCPSDACPSGGGTSPTPLGSRSSTASQEGTTHDAEMPPNASPMQ